MLKNPKEKLNIAADLAIQHEEEDPDEGPPGVIQETEEVDEEKEEQPEAGEEQEDMNLTL